MQLHELPQKFSDIALTLGTSNCAGNLFLHQDATPRAEPTTTDAMASFPEHKLFRLFGLAYEAGVQVLGHVLRQFHLAALTSEHAFLLFQSVTAFRAVHCEDCSRSWHKQAISRFDCWSTSDIGILQQLRSTLAKEEPLFNERA